MYHESNYPTVSKPEPSAQTEIIQTHTKRAGQHKSLCSRSRSTDLLFPTHSSISDAAPPCWSSNDRLFAQCFSWLDS